MHLASARGITTLSLIGATALVSPLALAQEPAPQRAPAVVGHMPPQGHQARHDDASGGLRNRPSLLD